MNKTIFIFNDGTGQHLKSSAVTNVAKLFNARPGTAQDMLSADAYKVDPITGNVAIYIRGIGTEDSHFIQQEKDKSILSSFWSWITQKTGESSEQIFGTTIIDRVSRSYKVFKAVYQDGDEIVLVGFSRGAASIRILASELIKRDGVVIKYMLVFDTVYSVSGEIKILDNKPTNRFSDFDVSEKILKCDHLVAGDEMREKFPLSPVNKRAGVRQVLFPGSHSDVGGGHESTELSDIALEFALDQFSIMGYAHDSIVLADLKVLPNPLSKITYVVLGGTGQRHFPRDFGKLDFVVHRSIIDRSKGKGTVSIALSQLCTFTTNSSEVLVDLSAIDASFDR